MIKRLFLKMTFPQIFSAMTGTLCMLIDSVVIGQFLGVDAMSAFGLAAPILIIFTSLGLMLSGGVQAVCAKLMGIGDMDEAGACFSSSVILSLALGAAGILVILIFLTPVCVLLGTGKPGNGNELFKLTGAFLKGYIPGAPLFFLSQILSPYLQALGKRKQLYCSVAVMILADAVFDLLCVRVWHGGMFGIGLSSVFSYLFSLLVCIGFFLKKDCPLRFTVRGVRSDLIRDILKAGSPVIIGQLFYVMRVYCFNLLLLGIAGTQAVAAFSTVSTLGNILYSIGLGGGSVALLLSSLFFSEEDRGALTELVRIMVPCTFLIIAAAAAVCEGAAPWLIRLFFEEHIPAYVFGVEGLRLFSLALIPGCLNTVFKNYYQGIRHTGLTNLISFLEAFALTTPAAWLLSRFFGMPGFWAGSILGQGLTLLIISIIVWTKAGRLSFSPEVYSYLNPAFGMDPSQLREFHISDSASAMEASREAYAFCAEKGMDRKTCMLISLCAEEIGMNIVLHGIGKDRRAKRLRPRQLHLRLSALKDRCVVQFRDDCDSFDPTTYQELHKNEDPFEHVGIRMILGLAHEADYVNSFGLNNLTLVIQKRG